MLKRLVRLTAMGFAVIPYILQSGGGSDSKIVFPGSAAGGNDLVFSIGDGNKELEIKNSGALLDAGDAVEGLQAAGSEIVAQSFGLNTSLLTAEFTVASTVFVSMVNLPVSKLLTGIKFIQTQQGVYTATGDNRLGLYTLSGSNLLLVASTANNGDLWKDVAVALHAEPFSTPYFAKAGIYWVGMIHTRTVESTAPKIAAAPNTFSGIMSDLDLPNSGKTFGVATYINTLPSTIDMDAEVIGAQGRPWFALY
jgi:hypothetical protein